MGRLEQAPEQSEKRSPAEGVAFERFLESAEAFDASTAGSGESTIEELQERGARELPVETRTIFIRRAREMENLFDRVKRGVLAAEEIAGSMERAMRTQDFGEWLSRRWTAALELAQTGVLASMKVFVPEWLRGQEEGTADAMPVRERALTFLGQLRIVNRIIDEAREEMQKLPSVTTYEEGLEVLTKLDGYKNSLVNSWDGSSAWTKHIYEDTPRFMRMLYAFFPFIESYEREKQADIKGGVEAFGSSLRQVIDAMRDTGALAGELLLASQSEKDIQQIIRSLMLSGALSSSEAHGLVPQELLEAEEFERITLEMRKEFSAVEQAIARTPTRPQTLRHLEAAAKRLVEVLSRDEGRLIDATAAGNLIEAARKMSDAASAEIHQGNVEEFIKAFRACRNSLIDRLSTERPTQEA